MRCRYGDKETNRQTHTRSVLRHREPKRPSAAEATPSNIRGCQSGTVRCLLDRKILEEHLQNSNESMENKTKAKTTKKRKSE